MKKAHILFESDEQCIKSDLFLDIARQDNIASFTRKRVMDLVDLIISLITRKGLSAKMDIRNFYKAKEVKFKISNVAYYKQRMKLNPEAISFLNNNRIDNYYSTEPNLKKFKEHFITAIDGSKVVLPTTNELLEHYGGQKNKTKTVAMLGFSTVYDVLNNMVFEGIIDMIITKEL